MTLELAVRGVLAAWIPRAGVGSGHGIGVKVTLTLAIVGGRFGVTLDIMKHSKHLAALSLLGLSACLMPELPPIEDSLIRSAQLSTVNPSSIAVLAVEDRTGGEMVTPLLESMRHQLGMSLIDRHYSPLNSVYVDGRMRRAVQNASSGSHSTIETDYLASLAGQADEDAILAVQVSHWDQAGLLVNNQVSFVAKVTLFGSADKTVLWSGDIRGTVVAGGTGAAPRDPEERAQAAAREMVKELLNRLPRRRA